MPPPLGPVAPMHLDVVSEFPYKHSTGETIGRFLAGLKEQRQIWGQRAAGQGVGVPPLGYSEGDGSTGGGWGAGKSTGTLVARAPPHPPPPGRPPPPPPPAPLLLPRPRRPAAPA